VTPAIGCANAAAVASVEASSPTRISKVYFDCSASSESMQASVNGIWLYTGITIETSGASPPMLRRSARRASAAAQ
jgi:hypothetical protein